MDLLAATNAALARELSEIRADGHGLSQATMLRLEQLVQRMRPAAAARQELGDLNERLLLAGVQEWQRRQGGDSG